jgi:hypothetical protein
VECLSAVEFIVNDSLGEQLATLFAKRPPRNPSIACASYNSPYPCQRSFMQPAHTIVRIRVES